MQDLDEGTKGRDRRFRCLGKVAVLPDWEADSSGQGNGWHLSIFTDWDNNFNYFQGILASHFVYVR